MSSTIKKVSRKLDSSKVFRLAIIPATPGGSRTFVPDSGIADHSLHTLKDAAFIHLICNLDTGVSLIEEFSPVLGILHVENGKVCYLPTTSDLVMWSRADVLKAATSTGVGISIPAAPYHSGDYMETLTPIENICRWEQDITEALANLGQEAWDDLAARSGILKEKTA